MFSPSRKLYTLRSSAQPPAFSLKNKRIEFSRYLADKNVFIIQLTDLSNNGLTKFEMDLMESHSWMEQRVTALDLNDDCSLFCQLPMSASVSEKLCKQNLQLKNSRIYHSMAFYNAPHDGSLWIRYFRKFEAYSPTSICTPRKVTMSYSAFSRSLRRILSKVIVLGVDPSQMKGICFGNLHRSFPNMVSMHFVWTCLFKLFNSMCKKNQFYR